MEADTRRHLDKILGAAARNGFVGAELQREARRRGDHGVWGWALTSAGHPLTGDIFIIETVLEDDGEAYAEELEQLLTLSARVSAPLSDPRATPTGAPGLDLAFLVRYLVHGPACGRKVAKLLLEHVDVDAVAAAFRLAFELQPEGK